MPFVRPVITLDVAGGAPVTVTGVPATAPTNGVTVYDVNALPFDDGAVQLTDA